jgi:predicted Zn-dependent peptidase
LEYQYHTLKNGIRIIHRQVAGKVSHCGLLVNTGSRDESENENGLAHLIEHLIFKGTNKRKAHHVLSRIENIGGELNAFTTKEETCVYASFLSGYYEHSIELFADVAFNSVFPQKEINKEKDVIIDEINSYYDSPGELIFDDFEDLIFKGHSLGRNILGTIGNVERITRKDILRFVKSRYSTDELVIASVGQIDFNKLIHLAEKHFGSIKSTPRRYSRTKFSGYVPSSLVEVKNSYLSHTIIGNVAYERSHPEQITLLLLTNYLGGPALNSRLSMQIREKHGYAYSVEAMYQPYSDTGVFNIYIGSDNSYVEKSIKLAKYELSRLRKNKLGSMQLHRAKKQIAGQLAISSESYLNEMLGIAKAHLHKPRVKTIEEIISEIDDVTSDRIIKVANEIFDPEQLSTLIYSND